MEGQAAHAHGGLSRAPALNGRATLAGGALALAAGACAPRATQFRARAITVVAQVTDAAVVDAGGVAEQQPEALPPPGERLTGRWLGRPEWQSIAVAPDRRTFAVGTERSVQLRRVADARIVWDRERLSPGHVAFSRDGARLLEVFEDGSIPRTDRGAASLRMRTYAPSDGAIVADISIGTSAPVPRGSGSFDEPPVGFMLEGLEEAPTPGIWHIESSLGSHRLVERRTPGEVSRLGPARAEGLRPFEELDRWATVRVGSRVRRVPLPCARGAAAAAIDPALDRVAVRCEPDGPVQLRSLSTGARVGTLSDVPFGYGMHFIDARTVLVVSNAGFRGMAVLVEASGPSTRTVWREEFSTRGLSEVSLSPDGTRAVGVSYTNHFEVLDLRSDQVRCSSVSRTELRPAAAGFSDEDTLWMLQRESRVRVRLPGCEPSVEVLPGFRMFGGISSPPDAHWVATRNAFIVTAHTNAGNRDALLVPTVGSLDVALVPGAHPDERLLFTSRDGSLLGLTNRVTARIVGAPQGAAIEARLNAFDAIHCGAHVVAQLRRDGNPSSLQDVTVFDAQTLRAQGYVPGTTGLILQRSDCVDGWLLGWFHGQFVAVDLRARTSRVLALDGVLGVGREPYPSALRIAPDGRSALVHFGAAGWLSLTW